MREYGRVVPSDMVAAVGGTSIKEFVFAREDTGHILN